MRLYPLILFFLVSIHCFGLSESQYAQIEQKSDTLTAPAPLKFEQEKIDFYKASPEFDYTDRIPRENWWTNFKRYVNLQYERLLHWLFGDYEASSILLFFIELLPYLVLALVLFLAIWLFHKMNYSGNSLNNHRGGQVILSEDEEIIQSQDISRLIDKAVADGKYRLAVRYNFLLILQVLSQQGLINYEFSKTDEDYLKEIQNPQLQVQFKELTRIYDFIWYGDFYTTEAHYKRIKTEFDKMLELIKIR